MPANYGAPSGPNASDVQLAAQAATRMAADAATLAGPGVRAVAERYGEAVSAAAEAGAGFGSTASHPLVAGVAAVTLFVAASRIQSALPRWMRDGGNFLIFSIAGTAAFYTLAKALQNGQSR